MFFANLLLLIMGHCYADTAGQPKRMAHGKHMLNKPHYEKISLWWHWLTHHAMIHGFFVTLIVYLICKDLYFSLGLGLIEVGTHWIIDFFRCKNYYNPNIEQLLHISMKVIYCVIIKLYMGGIRWERLFFGM